jgi:membrane-associated phospholipid phosphatase
MSPRPPLLCRPSVAQLAYALRLGAAQSLLFALVYGGADLLTRLRTYRVALHTSCDLALPLVPSAALFYLSINPLLWMAPLVLRTRDELRAYVASLAAATLAAGFGFVLLPADDAFAAATSEQLGAWSGAYALAQTIALRHNYFPSLHVAFTVICISTYGRYGGLGARTLLWTWGVAIVASTLLSHQHYFVDVVAGAALGAVSKLWVFDRLAGLPVALPTEEQTIVTSRTNRSEPPV